MNFALENSLAQSLKNRVVILVIGLVAATISIALPLMFGANGYLAIPIIVAVGSFIALIVNIGNYNFLFGEAILEGIRTY